MFPSCRTVACSRDLMQERVETGLAGFKLTPVSFLRNVFVKWEAA
jgi:hypothetical protein